MRERHSLNQADSRPVGITPARAGKTYCCKDVYYKIRDHPRSCGKDLQFTAQPIQILGSPPLVRERQGTDGLLTFTARITPARAGKTKRPFPGCRASQDHPRSCGKDIFRLVPFEFSPGSPPLVRERPHGLHPAGILGRITPARAGKTKSPILSGFLGQDHPRSCGKDARWVSVDDVTVGSPPLVRERLRIFVGLPDHHRITPARAGKTCHAKPRRWPGRDHPRSCGKDKVVVVFQPTVLGSPPLVRERHISGE